MNKLACYLDELDENPTTACEIADQLGIKNVCLRRVWGTNIAVATDATCQMLMGAIRRNNLSVAAICTDIGDMLDDTNFLTEQAAIQIKAKRSALIAKYFHASIVRFFAGRNLYSEVIHAWLTYITKLCSDLTIEPAVEIEHGSSIFNVNDAVAAFKASGCRWWYDPALLINRVNQDPLVYWQQLRRYCAAVDLRDYKIGVGYQPVGYGDCQWDKFDNKGFTGWYFLEPNLGKRFGKAHTRKDVCALALEAVRNLPSLSSIEK